MESWKFNSSWLRQGWCFSPVLLGWNWLDCQYHGLSSGGQSVSYTFQTASHSDHRESSLPPSAQCCSGCLWLFSQSMRFRTRYKHSPWYPYGISGAFSRHWDRQIFCHKTRKAFWPVQVVPFPPLWGYLRWSCVSGCVSLDLHPGWNLHHIGHTCQSSIIFSNFFWQITWRVFHQCASSHVCPIFAASQNLVHKNYIGKVLRGRALELREQSTCQHWKNFANTSETFWVK